MRQGLSANGLGPLAKDQSAEEPQGPHLRILVLRGRGMVEDGLKTGRGVWNVFQRYGPRSK